MRETAASLIPFYSDILDLASGLTHSTVLLVVIIELAKLTSIDFNDLLISLGVAHLWHILSLEEFEEILPLRFKVLIQLENFLECNVHLIARV